MLSTSHPAYCRAIIMKAAIGDLKLPKFIPTNDWKAGESCVFPEERPIVADLRLQRFSRNWCSKVSGPVGEYAGFELLVLAGVDVNWVEQNM